MTTELQTDIVKARAELAATFEAIEYKLNVPAQAKRAVSRAKTRVRTLAKENPALLAGAVAAAAAVIGGAVWLAIRVTKK